MELSSNVPNLVDLSMIPSRLPFVDKCGNNLVSDGLGYEQDPGWEAEVREEPG